MEGEGGREREEGRKGGREGGREGGGRKEGEEMDKLLRYARNNTGCCISQ